MQVGKGQGFKETVRTEETGVGLAGEADKHVRTHSQTKDPGDGIEDQVPIEHGMVGTIHPPQDRSITALERHVQMRAEAGLRCHAVQQLTGNLPRLEGTQA